jgi:hypothetical protein
MTLKIFSSNANQNQLYWNIANLADYAAPHDWKLAFKSQWSNTVIYEAPSMGTLVITTNSRYTKCTFSTAALDLTDQHINGVYEARLYNDVLGLEYKQLVKIITSPGGSTGTKPYISDNEDREAIVYYKPEY